MMNALVSIIIPTYNAASLIGETLESVEGQNYSNWECIIVDDGSSDNTEIVVSEFLQKDKRFQYHKRSEVYKSGGNGARNNGYHLSKGDYIQYLDADDLLAPDKIEKQMDLILQYGNENIYSCSIAYFNERIENSQKLIQKVDRPYDEAKGWLVDSWSGGGFGQTMNWLTSRDLHEKAGLWKEDLKKNQDGEFFSRVLLQAKKVIYCEDTICYYRKGIETSISVRKDREAVQSAFSSYKMYEENIKPYQNKSLNKALAHIYYNFILTHYPNFPDLISEARQRIKSSGFKESDFTGKGGLYYLEKIVGFNLALYLSNKYAKIFKTKK